METGFSKEKIVGFIAVILIVFLFIVLALKIVDKNKEKKAQAAQNVTYKQENIKMRLNSDYVEYISIGEKYVETGIKALDRSGKDLSKDVIVSYFKDGSQVSSVKTYKLNNYLVKYTVLDSSGSQSIYKTVIVIDDKSPSISFPDKTVITTKEVLSFDLEEGVIVTDNSGKADLTYDNNLSNVPGDYIITYKAKDESGNIKEKKRLIKVKKTQEIKS